MNFKIIEDAPYRASLMPAHISGEVANGTTSNYFKHTSPISRHVDYESIKILGQSLTKEQMITKFAEFISTAPTYGLKNGACTLDGRIQQASRIFNAMRKEGLIVEINDIESES